MGYHVPERVIKLLCGREAFDQGMAYYTSGKVQLVYAEHNEKLEYSKYRAEITGLELCEVTLAVDIDGDVSGDCTCPAYVHGGAFCKHIAAGLVCILHSVEVRPAQDREHSAAAITGPSASRTAAADSGLVSSMLQIFGDRRRRASGTGIYMDTRTPLQAEFTVKQLSLGRGRSMLGVELKIGQQRLYVVKKIRAFLTAVQRGETFAFSDHFVYDPAQHSFAKEDDHAIKQLIEVLGNEQVYREAQPSYSQGIMGTERLLPIPPYFWERLLAALAAAPAASLQLERDVITGLHPAAEYPPLSFHFNEAEGAGYLLEIRGLSKITVMEDYGLLTAEGKLLKLPETDIRRLAGLKQMLAGSSKDEMIIAPEQMEAFMEGVLPGLKRLGRIEIADRIFGRIVQSPLRGRLYLDRIRDRLLAGLEFQYGDVVLNPLDPRTYERGEQVILVRDTAAEQQILELMEHPAFVQTESGYVMSDEEGEFDFLHHTIPQLEPLLEVYATTAVKSRLYTGNALPIAKLSWNEKTDWLEFRFSMSGVAESEIISVLKSLQEKRRYYRLPDGALLPLEGEALQEVVRLMNELGVQAGDLTPGAGYPLPLLRALQLKAEDYQEGAVTLNRSFRRLLADMASPDSLDFQLPGTLAPVLRDYQQYGYQWLKTLAHYRFGGILADDMGLGKTLQSIAFLLSELEDIRSGGVPALIVAPASLLYNWRNELHKFAPDIKAAIADGPAAQRSRTIRNTAAHDVVITSYPLLRRDIGMYAKHKFHTLILDEAQMIKNHETQTAQAVSLLEARYRFALTGTPVENALEDLWSIFSVVMPGLFPGKKEFHDLPRETVAKRAKPFLLRRLKSDVLKELPDKIETVQASELLPEQKKLYVAYLARLRKEALKHLDDDSFGNARIKVLAGLTRLRQLCCHPALFLDGYAGGSGKFAQLLEIIEECRSSGKRMLVFSQFTGMLDLIGRELGMLGIPFFYLDGDTPSSVRVERCNRFNEGERDLFLISLKAGGTGLNLTGADTVILYDLWWNPAVEQQAADRAHRIGQKKVVQVIRMVAQGTVEDKMVELQQKKTRLIDEVIQPGSESLSTFSEQDLRDILSI
ncbi:DEAD/DEAH box helicase [Paenibacillus tengchongensis]|uniref:DEAD/DEAH box helicase n=1 Tax=Paenibacillus tengchongensis TaxID=2608684 RepID=UPI001FECDD0E|nr:DEAD/DEAH box helicase [Paenibacillus tengchongensis]